MSNIGRNAYDLAFQVSPIVLTGGIASRILGGVLPIIGFLAPELIGLAQGLLATGNLSLEDIPVRFVPQTGTEAIAQVIGEYPFATRSIAANATIEMPRNIVLKMISPVNSTGGYLTKLGGFTAMQSALNSHNNSGGTYTVLTPSLIYDNCILLSVSDVTQTSSKQQQIEWLFTFRQPLISLQSVQQQLGALMSMLNNGSQVTSSSWSGQLGIGQFSIPSGAL